MKSTMTIVLAASMLTLALPASPQHASATPRKPPTRILAVAPLPPPPSRPAAITDLIDTIIAVLLS
jgi:hypothetical protein